MKHIIIATIAALCLSLPQASAADTKTTDGPRPLAIQLGAPFHDHAVLQRGMEVPVWGWSKPGTTVTVEFAGQKETAKAGDDGKWMAQLKPLKASVEPAEMVIQEQGGKTEIAQKHSRRRSLDGLGTIQHAVARRQMRCEENCRRPQGQGRITTHPRISGHRCLLGAASDRARHGRMEGRRLRKPQCHRLRLRAQALW